MAISLYCPPTVNRNLSDMLTKDIYGRNVKLSKAPKFTVMWSTTEVPQNITKFFPNHFSVIKQIETLPQSTEILDLDESFDHNFIPRETSSPRDKCASFLPKSCFLDAFCNPMGKRKNELDCETTSSKRKKTDDNITHLTDSSNFVLKSVNLTRWSAHENEFEKCAGDIFLCSEKNSDKTVLYQQLAQFQ